MIKNDDITKIKIIVIIIIMIIIQRSKDRHRKINILTSASPEGS
jgi:hypothetical protein